MQTARYHREQAELCLEMARSMSDRQAADMLCTAAARHFAEALEVEKKAGSSSGTAHRRYSERDE
jgi:hypothetical protein